MKLFNDFLVFSQILLHPYRYIFTFLSIVYLIALSVILVVQEKKRPMPKNRYIGRAVHFCFALGLVFYSFVLMAARPDSYSELNWIVPLCACPFPMFSFVVLIFEKFFARERLRDLKK